MKLPVRLKKQFSSMKNSQNLTLNMPVGTGSWEICIIEFDRKIVDVIESNGLSLDGDGSYVEIDDSEIINNISEQVTISAWIKPTDFPNTCMTILFKGNKRQPDITHRQFTFWLFDEGNVFFDTSPGGRPLRYTVSEIESIQKDNWYHVAGTIDAEKNTMKLYLNGFEVGRNSFSNSEPYTQNNTPITNRLFT